MIGRINKKWLIAQVTQLTQLSRLGMSAQKRLLHNQFVRAINYHKTPAADRKRFIKQLHFYKTHFDDVSLGDLEQFFQERRWHKAKPGLIISFDDGYYDNYEVAVPLLEEFGFTGWFFAPSDWVEAATAIREGRHQPPSKSDGRLMAWDDLRSLLYRPRPHVVGCHTATHHRLGASCPKEQLRAEIIGAKHTMQEKLQQEISAFCWVGGEEKSYSAAAACLIREAGYKFSFMTNNAPIVPSTSPLQLQRTNIETHDPMEVVEFQLSGMMDCLYSAKRRRVNRLTAS